MINFIVRNRNEIERGWCPLTGRSILISITDPDKMHATPHPRYENVFYAKFDDADVQVTPDTKLINGSTARNIVGFVKTSILGGVDTVVVNCEAGISRSAGVAAALSYIFNGSDRDIVKIRPMYNRTVYRAIINAYMENRP